MITVHSGWETDFSGLGICPLQPTECTVEEQAGGLYQLKMTHPMDDEGRWLNLTAWNIIRAPAPVRETPYINMMVHTETTVTRSIYTVRVNTRLRLRTKPSNSTGVIIGRYKNGTEVIKTGQSGDWYQVIVCSGGQMGWMHSDYLTFARNETETVPGEDVPGKTVEPRQTRDQLFRIMSVSRDDEARMVYVTAMHVFYDLTGVTVGSEYSPDKVAASAAAQAVFEKAIKAHGFEIYSNNDEKISGEYTGRSIVSVLLEEDGIVQQSKARLVRDNFDVFVLKDDVRDRGVEIRHGKNLQGAELTIDVSDVVTSVIPVGRNKNGDPIRLSGQIYVDADNAAELPVVRAKEIEYDVRTGSDGFDTDAKVRAELERLARAEYTDNGINLPTIGLNVSFVMLENTRQHAEIQNYAALQSVHLYDIVRVISAGSGIDAMLRVTGYVYNCITRKYDDVTLGELFELDVTISGYDISTGTLSGNKLISGTVSGDKVQNATIQYAKIAQAAIEQLSANAITAIRANIHEIVAGNITTDQLYADLAVLAAAQITAANIDKANINWAEIQTLTAQIASIAKAQINTANIGSAQIDWAQIDTLNALIAQIAQAKVDDLEVRAADIKDLSTVVAQIFSANIGSADIGFAQIKDLVAGTAIITQGVGGELYIARLAVTEANMVSLTVGELLLKNADGDFVRLVAGEDGGVTTEVVQVEGGNIADATINGGQKIIEGSITAAVLNVQDIFADSAIVRQLIAENIDVGKLFARQAFIAELNATDIRGNQYLKITVDGLSDDIAAANDAANAAMDKANSNATVIDGIQTTITQQQTEINQTKDQLILTATKAELTEAVEGVQADVTSLGERMSSAEAKLTPEAITLTVQENLKLGGANLIRQEGVSVGWVDDTGALVADEGYRASAYIPVTPGEDLIFQIWRDAPDGYTLWQGVTYFDSDLAYIDGSYSTQSDPDSAALYMIRRLTAPEGAAYIRVSYRWSEPWSEVTPIGNIIKEYRVKLERGSVATDWSNAPEELISGTNVRITDKEFAVTVPKDGRALFAVKDASDEDETLRLDADGMHAQRGEFDVISSPSVVPTWEAGEYAPESNGDFAALLQNMDGHYLKGRVTVDASNVVGGAYDVSGLTGPGPLVIQSPRIAGLTVKGCSVPVKLTNPVFTTAGDALTAENSFIALTDGSINAQSCGIVASGFSRVIAENCTGSCVPWQATPGGALNPAYLAKVGAGSAVIFTGANVPYGLAEISPGGEVYAAIPLRLTDETPTEEIPEIVQATLPATLTKTYDSSWRDGNDLYQGRYGTRTLNRGCMWFDLTAISGKTILSATLTLRRMPGAGTGSNLTANIHGTSATGASGTPGIGAKYASVSVAQNASKSVDVTSAVQALADGTIRGLMLYDARTTNGSGGYTAGYGKFYGHTSGYRPYLTVTYQ